MGESMLTLPQGWELEGGVTELAGPQVQAVEMYGGATMNWALDGASIWYLGCCAKKDGGSLYFSIFRLQNGVLTNVPISGAGTGRGWLDVAHDGWMYWSSWEGSAIRPASGPARVPGAAQVRGGGYVAAPNGSIRVFVDQDGFTGQVTVNLASHGIPQASALNVKLSLDANSGVIFRCGPPVSDPNLQAAAMLSVSGLGVAIRSYESGVIAASPAQTLLIKAEAPIAKGFVDVFGWWL